MDTKLKKSSPFLVWLCFFLGLSIVVSLSLTALYLISGSRVSINDAKAALSSNFKDSDQFKVWVSHEFGTLMEAALNDEGSKASINTTNNAEGSNITYYAVNDSTNLIITNAAGEKSVRDKINGKISLPEGFDYYLYFNGNKFILYNAGKFEDIYNNQNGYINHEIWAYLRANALELRPELSKIKVLMFVKKEIAENPYIYSELYSMKTSFDEIRYWLIGIASIFFVGLILLVFSIILRKRKHEIDRKLAALMGWFWVEAKITATTLLFMFVRAASSGSVGNQFESFIFGLFIFGFFGWWLYLLLVDLIVNRKKVFTNNIINSILRSYRSFESKKPFQKAQMFRLYALIVIEAVLIIVVTFIFTGLTHEGNGIAFFLLLLFLGTGVYLLYRYTRRFSRTVADWGHLVDRIEILKSGKFDTGNTLSPDADLYPTEDNLSKLQEGFTHAVEERIKSERMKAELVTNVSHDLKTPLTSIVSYVDLLSREEGLPVHVQDYIKILADKSEKLKNLIQDLFELSRATSGSITVEKEKIDIGKLVQQTVADMNEEIEKAGLVFRMGIPEEPVIIESDGGKLYRVFQNLVSNTLKYSLTGTRVYIDLYVKENFAEVTIKNTSNYEMNFCEEEITERFVRGDKARSTEGSGLGLSIARSFAEACGGSLQIKIDGDLFKVIVRFPLSF